MKKSALSGSKTVFPQAEADTHATPLGFDIIYATLMAYLNAHKHRLRHNRTNDIYLSPTIWQAGIMGQRSHVY